MYPVKEFKYGRFERTINVPAGLQSHLGQGHKRVLGGWHT
jgi:hypothetical protein